MPVRFPTCAVGACLWAALVAGAAVPTPARAATALPRSCALVFVEETGAAWLGLRRLVFEVAYLPGKLVFGSPPVACAVDTSQTGVASVFTADDAAGRLRVDLSRANGMFPGPLARCTAQGSEDAPSYMPDVTLVTAEDLRGRPLSPAPVVSIDTFDCVSTSSTTTLPAPTTTVTDSPTTTIEPAPTTTLHPPTTTTLHPPTTTTFGPVTTTTASGTVTTTTLSAPVLCGDGDGNGVVSAPDALLVLRHAVGLASCPASRCDTDASNSVTASDALRILRAAVGLPDDLDCP